MRTVEATLIVGTTAAAIAVIALTYPVFETGTVAAPLPDVATAADFDPGEDLTLVNIFEMSEAGVVQITVTNTTTGEGSTGSGFVFDRMGHIITNAHVVRDGTAIEVTFLDGRTYEAEVTGADEHTDLAVVRVDADADLMSPLAVGDSSVLRVGQQVAAIGNPFGLSGSMTSGIVSQIDRMIPVETGFSIPDVVQTDAAINPGNSGGPLLNMRGEVIGVNMAIQTNTGQFAGVGFAIPSRTVSKIVPTLIADGKYDHPWIGVSGTDISPALADLLNLTDTRGFHIVAVIEGSPADRAGLRGSNHTVQYEGNDYTVGGDIIIAVDDITVRKISDILLHLQRSKAVGDELQLQILRDGELLEKTLVLEKRPDSVEQ